VRRILNNLEAIVAKKSKRKDEKQVTEKTPLNAPWISMRNGIIIITITSIAMAVLTAWEVIPTKGVTQGLLYGILFGGLIWIIFFGFILFRRLFH
jgi:N-acetylmuramic acid 6-phosphate (MurNAc-6-P) etherase